MNVKAGFREYAPAVLFALCLHLLLIWVMTHRFSEAPSMIIKKPEIIKATLVKREPSSVDKNKETLRQQQLIKAKQEQARRLEREKQQKEKLKKEAALKKQAEQERQKKREIAKAEALKKQKAEALKRQKKEELLQRAAREEEAAQQRLLEQIANDEQQLNEAQQAADKSQAISYMAVIKKVVEDNWSRPPSARNGMEVLLDIQLIPNGTVVQVDIAKSSGNVAFDRSAVLAVKKAERFNELSELPGRVFEKYYRQFRLLFKPEDLRL